MPVTLPVTTSPSPERKLTRSPRWIRSAVARNRETAISPGSLGRVPEDRIPSWRAASVVVRTRTSVLGPVDRALGLGFGALKGLVVASLLFLLATLLFDFMGGGPRGRPEWMRTSRTYPLLNATSAGIADFVDRRRRGEPVFGAGTKAARASETDE